MMRIDRFTSPAFHALDGPAPPDDPFRPGAPVDEGGPAAAEAPPPEAPPLDALARSLLLAPESRAGFARAAAYYSANPEITGSNRGITKAELFAGDLLYAGGFAAPTYTVRTWDGAPGVHYSNAERWPRATDHFQKVTDQREIRPGDLLVVDHRGKTGRAGGHVEVITAVGPEGITTAGARPGGLAEDDRYGKLLAGATPRGDRFFHDAPGGGRDADLFVLRPIRPLPPPFVATGPLRA